MIVRAGRADLVILRTHIAGNDQRWNARDIAHSFEQQRIALTNGFFLFKCLVDGFVFQRYAFCFAVAFGSAFVGFGFSPGIRVFVVVFEVIINVIGYPSENSSCFL